MRAVYLIIVTLLLLSCNDDSEKLTVRRTDLIESVYSSVTVQPDSLYDAYSVVSGIVDRVLVKEGDTIVRGQPLIQIINNAPRLNAENARLSLELARENYSGGAAVLSGIQDEIRAAKLQLKNDSVSYFRQKNLWAQNIGSKAEYDRSELKYELASNNLKLLESRYDRTRNELETAVQQAKNSYEASLINTRDYTVQGIINGKVYAIYKKEGELVSSQQSLMKIGSLTNFILELLVDESDIVRIKNGQKILVTLDAYKDQIFEGKVSRILPNKDIRNQSFTVEALFTVPPETLYPGLSGEANIIINTRKDVIAIPNEYVIDGGEVKTDRGRVRIETGLNNLYMIEVVDGLEEGDVIYRPDQ